MFERDGLVWREMRVHSIDGPAMRWAALGLLALAATSASAQSSPRPEPSAALIQAVERCEKEVQKLADDERSAQSAEKPTAVSPFDATVSATGKVEVYGTRSEVLQFGRCMSEFGYAAK